MTYEIAFWTLFACFCLSACETGLKVGFAKWKSRQSQEKIKLLIVLDREGKFLSVKCIQRDWDKLDISLSTEGDNR